MTVVANPQVAGYGANNFYSSTVASGAAVALTTATAANVTSLALIPGEYDLSAAVDFALAGVTGTLLQAAISLTSATLPTQPGGSGLGTDPLVLMPLITTALSATATLSISPVRLVLTATTTVYLVAQQTFSAGTTGAYGTLRARRMNA